VSQVKEVGEADLPTCAEFIEVSTARSYSFDRAAMAIALPHILCGNHFSDFLSDWRSPFALPVLRSHF
jgi:hypothetical protein